jgi:hypothetical protein
MTNKILLVDDDEDFAKSFQVEAQRRGFSVFHKKSLEGLRQVMPKFQKSVFSVVLDIKCLTSDNQIKEDAGFIGPALTYLDSNSPGFPRVILTGDDAVFENFKGFNPNEILFQKTPDGIINSFNKLKFFHDNAEEIGYRIEHPRIFALIDSKYLGGTSYEDIINILRESSESDFIKFGGALRNVRAFQEAIYKKINSTNKAVVPDSVFKTNGMIIFNDLMRHLNGNPTHLGGSPTTTVYQNSAIYNISNSLYWTCGKYIHADPLETYQISNYTVKAVCNQLLELILWSDLHLP